MAAASCSEEEFISLWRRSSSPQVVASALGISVRNVLGRRRAIEGRRGIRLVCTAPNSPDMKVTIPDNGIRTRVDLENGVVIVGSDKHYWPGVISTAHRAAIKVIKDLKPQMYVCNGDAFDGPTAGRHPRIGWEKPPSVKEELSACQDRMYEIHDAMGGKSLFWNWGNHDIRFNTRLSAEVPTYEGVHGTDLKDHFPTWKFGWSMMINGRTMIKHRYHNGVHATYNNVLKSGTSIITGHLHALQVRPYTDYNGTRYAVDTGTLADPIGPQFTYAEDAPANHRSGFAVLTFHKGKLMPPELCEVVNEDEGLCFFRGETFTV